MSEATAPRVTPTQMALLLAAWEMNGGGRESELQKIAIGIERIEAPSSLHNHYSRAADALEEKGLFISSLVGTHKRWWITELGWRVLGEDPPAPRDPELPLF